MTSNLIDLSKTIRKTLDDLRIVDSHEHLRQSFSLKDNCRMDLPFFLTHMYLQGDLVSSGMPVDWFSPKNQGYLASGYSDDVATQRWRELEPFLDRIQNTSYYRYLLISLHDLYGLNSKDMHLSNWREVSRRIYDRGKNQLEWSIKILDMMKLYKVILNVSPTSLPYNEIVNDERLVQVVNLDNYIRGDLRSVEGSLSVKIKSFDDYLESINQTFEKAVKAGAIGVKSALAYERTIFFSQVSKSKARDIFLHGLQGLSTNERLSPRTITEKGKMFEDFIMHYICESCAKHELPFQIHTGIQGGNFNIITNAKPTYLTNLFQKYPEVKFDLFHVGYPYTEEAGLMAKYFPNVYLDACWLAHISPAAYKRGLDEWLEILPANKIFAWGGDHSIIEHSYASLMLAKDLISEVLANKVDNGYFTMKVAKSVAKKILGENSIKVYDL